MDRLLELAHKYCECFEKELEDHLKKIDKPNPIAPADIEIADTLWHGLKSLKTVEAMLDKSYGEERYSGSYRMPTTRPSDYYSGRGRDSMGRYTRDNDKAEMMGMLEDKMRSARTEDEAIAIRDAMDAISRLR